jgi:hypothetical protein
MSNIARNGRKSLRCARRASLLFAAAVLVATACSGSGSTGQTAGPDAEPAPQTTSSPAVGPAEPTSAEVSVPPTEQAEVATASPSAGGDDVSESTPGLVNADPVVVSLTDFEISIDTNAFASGTVNFEVSNPDDGPHEFNIARGTSYTELPMLPNGSVDEEALGDDFLGKTSVLMAPIGSTKVVSYDLEPGSYVLFCNLGESRTFSHAAAGMVLSVVVE